MLTRAKKRAPRFTNWADKNSSILILVININNNFIITLSRYIKNPGVFNAWGIFKPCQISKMVGHIENSSIVRTIYSGIFRGIQQHSTTFRNIKGHQGIVRHIQSLLRYIEPYPGIFKTLCNPCIQNRAIFRTLHI